MFSSSARPIPLFLCLFPMVDPVDALPGEIFVSTVGSAVTSLPDLVAVSHVSAAWRRAVLNAPGLWAAVLNGPTAIPFRALAGVLALTKDAPVFLKLYFKPSCADAMLALLERHLRHACGLSLRVYRDKELWIRLMRILTSTPAPVLETFGVVHHISLQHALPADIFASYAPRLHTVGVQQALLPHHPYPAFATLRSLAVQMEISPSSHSQRLDGHLFKFLPQQNNYAELRELRLLTGMSLIPGVAAHDRILANLHYLEIAFFEGVEAIHTFLLARPWPTTLRVYNAMVDEAVGWIFQSPTLEYMRVLTEYYMYPNSEHFVETRDPAGHIRQIKFQTLSARFGGLAFMPAGQLDVVLNRRLDVPLEVFAHLRALAIHERYWPAAPVAAPALVDLTLFIQHPQSGHQKMWKGYDGVFNRASEDVPHSWDVPQLATLTLACPISHAKLGSGSRGPLDEQEPDHPLEAALVTLLVLQVLGFSTKRPLDRLVVKRMRLSEVKPGGVHLLRKLVRGIETVSVRDEPNVQVHIVDEMCNNTWFYRHWDKLFRP